MEDLHIYIINLDRATERWKQWENIDMGFPKKNIHRFSAVDGKKMNDNEISKYTTPLTFLKILGKVKRSPEDMDTKGALCCSLSHFGVWEDFLKNYPDSKYLLVLEDDSKLSNDHKKNLKTYIEKSFSELPDDNWDMWLLGYSILRDSSAWNNPQPTPYSSDLLKNPINLKNSNSRFNDVRSFWGSNAYIIKRDSIPKFKKYDFPIETHIDLYFSVLSQIGNVRLITDKNLVLRQSSILGDIDHTFFTIAILNQRDVIYKSFFIIFAIIILVFIFVYLSKGCYGYNFLNFLGNNFSCKV
jgi:GR25 family glycosyltransferase involved in LPS biosynthesis